ncbi:hypothetical protein ACFLQR_04795 [Verrucomicrobiota bacterium]
MVLNRSLYRTGWCLLAAVLGIGTWYARVYITLPALPAKATAVASVIAWPGPDLRDLTIDGSVFKKQQKNVRAASLGPLAKRFRLAGTFFAKGVNQQSRKAIVDVLVSRTQQLVSEGEVLDQTVQVKSIFQDYIVLREGNREEELWLSFSDAGKSGGNTGKQTGVDGAGGVAGEGATLNRFGKRVGDRRWVLSRSAVVGYYEELLNDTERLAKVFESMKPVYQGSSIAGYVLDVEGEGDMFKAFGLKQDDVIRKVNSMPMTSRFRAEYFIREFVKDRANAFVLDIERKGRSERLIYLVR